MIQSHLTEIRDLREQLLVLQIDPAVSDTTTTTTTADDSTDDYKDAMATVIGKLLLDQCDNPINACLSPEATVLYMTGWSENAKASAYALANSIPLFIAAFFADLCIFSETQISNLHDAIAKMCPSESSFHNIAKFCHERGYQKISEIVAKGIPYALAHDKGLRNSLSRLCIELTYRNENTGCPETVRLGCEGSHGSSSEVADAIRMTMDHIERYIENDEPLTNKACGYSTDSGGGGVGPSVVKESFDRDLCSLKAFYWNPCTMHALNKAVDNATSTHFGGGGQGSVNIVQFAHTCWTIQKQLGEDFERMWWKFVEGITDLDEKGSIIDRLPKPLLTRWGHVTTCLSSILKNWDHWFTFLSGIYENCSGSNSTMALYCIGIMKDPKARCEVEFVSTFANVFFDKHFTWLHMTDPLTKLAGHQCHETPLRVDLMRCELEELSKTWKNADGPFNFLYRCAILFLMMKCLAERKLGEESRQCSIKLKISSSFFGTHF